MTDDWKLPPGGDLVGPELNMGELLMIDWILTPGSGFYPGTATGVADLGEMKSLWMELRKSLWLQIASLDKELPPIQNKSDRDKALLITLRCLELSEDDAEILLTLCPTTWHWSIGPDDYGFFLCMKLAAYLRGEVWKYEILPTTDMGQPVPPSSPPDASSDG